MLFSLFHLLWEIVFPRKHETALRGGAAGCAKDQERAREKERKKTRISLFGRKLFPSKNARVGQALLRRIFHEIRNKENTILVLTIFAEIH